MKRPNLFIVGAPKCGTSALALYLSDHPSIFMSVPKEPNYFAHHLSTESQLRRASLYHTSFTHYLRLFEQATDRHVAVGEASTRYLRSERALCAIRGFNPEARIVVMLRNPVDLSYSWHGQKLYEGQENIEDFEKAWFLQFERVKGRHLPRNMFAKDALAYGKIASIGSQLEFLLSLFAVEQVKILFFEDFISETKKTYESVLQFLDVPLDNRIEFPIVNFRKSVRYLRLFRFIRHRFQFLDLIRETTYRKAGLKIPSVRSRILSILVNNDCRPPLDKSFRQYLAYYFWDEIIKVEKITGRNLDAWLKC